MWRRIKRSIWWVLALLGSLLLAGFYRREAARSLALLKVERGRTRTDRAYRKALEAADQGDRLAKAEIETTKRRNHRDHNKATARIKAARSKDRAALLAEGRRIKR